MQPDTVSNSLIIQDNPQTFLECCDALRSIQKKVGATINEMRQRGKDLILLRYDQGRIASLAREMDPEGVYGKETVKTLAQRAGIHERTLYRAIEFYEHFGGTKMQLRKWIDEKEEEKGSINWNYCINWTKKALPDSEGAEEKLEKVVKKVEKKAEKLEQDVEDIEHEVMQWNDEEKRAEALGAIAKAREVAEDAKYKVETFALEKPSRIEDKAFLALVRAQECECCSNAADAHHLITVGAGGSDYTAVPLCRLHHSELHTMPLRAFEDKYDVNLWRVNAGLLMQHFAGCRINT